MKKAKIFLAALFFFTWLQGQEYDEIQESQAKETITLSGYARGLAFLGGQDYDHSILMSELSIQGRMDIQQAFLSADIRFRKGKSMGNELNLVQVKELVAGYRGRKLDVMLGNQIISWGRTDGFNPNDNLSSSDYFFLSPDQDDQKLSNFLLQTSWRFTNMVDIELVAIPIYQPSIYRYDLFDMGENISFGEAVLPDRLIKNGSLAGRLNYEHTDFGISVCVFDGYDPFYGFRIDTVDWSSGSPQIQASPGSYRKSSMGADFDAVLGSMIIRGEIAYNLTDDYEEEMHIPNPDVEWVAALERSLGPVTLIGQYIGKKVVGFSDLEEPLLRDATDPLAQWNYANELIYYESEQFNRRLFNQQGPSSHAVSLILSAQFFYEALSLEVATYYNLTSEEYMLRPKIVWKIGDRISLSLGGSLMGGPEKTPFDYSGTVMNGAFVELRTGF